MVDSKAPQPQPAPRIPRFGAWTLDAAGRVHPFAPFAECSAPDPDQPGMRAVAALVAANGIALRRESVPVLSSIAAAVVTGVLVGAVAALSAIVASQQGGTLGGAAFGSITMQIPASIAVAFLLARFFRGHFDARHRARDAAAPILSIGRCGACGFPMRGATRWTEGAPDEPARCACVECGAVWPADAASMPRDPAGRSLAEFPSVEGRARRRARRSIFRALRAEPCDFVVDDAGEPRYPVFDAIDPAGVLRLAPTLLAALLMLPCFGFLALVVPGFVVGLASASAPEDPLVFHVIVAIVTTAVLTAVQVVGAPLWRRFRAQRVAGVATARLSKGECACCGMDLPPPAGAAPHLRACSCCGAAWRA